MNVSTELIDVRDKHKGHRVRAAMLLHDGRTFQVEMTVDFWSMERYGPAVFEGQVGSELLTRIQRPGVTS